MLGVVIASEDALGGDVEVAALRSFEVVARGESRPLAAIAAVMPDVAGMVETVEREDGLRAERADWVGLIPAATAAANDVVNPDPRRAAAAGVSLSDER